MVKAASICPTGRPSLSFSYRNAEQVEFKALKFDLVKYVQDTLEFTPTNGWWEYRNFQYSFFQNSRWTNYVRAEAQRWKEQVRREPGNLSVLDRNIETIDRRLVRANDAGILDDGVENLVHAEFLTSSASRRMT